MKYFLLLVALFLTETNASNDFIEETQSNNQHNIQVDIQDLEQQGNLQHPVTESVTYVIDNIPSHLAKTVRRAITGGTFGLIGGGLLPLACIVYNDYKYQLLLSDIAYLHASVASPITAILGSIIGGTTILCCSEIYEFYTCLTKKKQD